jgi:hypothetical protein
MPEPSHVRVRTWCARDSKTFLINFRLERPGLWKALSTSPDYSASTSDAKGPHGPSLPITEMTGSFIRPEFGCAFCGNRDYFKCACGAFVCQGQSRLRSDKQEFYCPECKRWARLEGYLSSLGGIGTSPDERPLPDKVHAADQPTGRRTDSFQSKRTEQYFKGDAPKHL